MRFAACKNIHQGPSFTDSTGENDMKRNTTLVREGKMGWILMWLLGVPLPLLFIAYLIFG